MENIEVWKDVVGYEGLYQISNLKKIKSLSKKKISITGGVYFTKEKILETKIKVVLTKNKIEKSFYIHKLYDACFFNNIDLIGEIWVDLKSISEVNGYYKISNYGRVKANPKIIKKSNGMIMTFQEKILNQNKHPKNGYYSVSLNNGIISKRTNVHRLVALHFLTLIKDKNEVNHIDSDKSNNRYDNLEWVSRAENQSHLSMRKRKTSNYIGVCLLKNNKWFSYITYNSKRVYLGKYETEYDAHLARKRFEKNNNIENKYSNGKCIKKR